MKPFLALFLALLIGNPMCCCAFGAETAGVSSVPNSCCSSSDGSTEKRPSESPSCGCSTDLEMDLCDGLRVPQAIESLRSSNDAGWLLGDASKVEITSPEVLNNSRREVFEFAVPSLGSRLARFCSYLI